MLYYASKKKRLNPEQKLNGGREATTGNASAGAQATDASNL